MRFTRCLVLGITVFVACAGVAGAAAPFGQITEFTSGFSPGALVGSLTPGSDGNLWFPDRGRTAIGEITPAGVITEYSAGLPAGSVPGSGSGGGIAFGPDGNIWFTDSGTSSIGVFNPFTHAVSEYNAGLNPGSSPYSIVAGPDGNVWFTDRGTTKAIGVINPTTHAISEYSSGLIAGSLPAIPTSGPDGNVWFSDGGTTKAMGRINVTTHVISEFTSGISSTGGSRPIAGPDGNLWFADKSPTAPAIGRITPSGVITEFPLTLLPGQSLNPANFGPDGGLWVGTNNPGGVARFDISTHAYTTISNGLSGNPGVIVVGSDQNMWYTDTGAGPGVARVGTAALAASSGQQIGYCSVSGNRNPATGVLYPPGTFVQLDPSQPASDPAYAGAVPANYLQGLGIACFVPPGYTATTERVGYGGHGDPGIYIYYTRPGG
jgi:streptogramin lyase